MNGFFGRKVANGTRRQRAVSKLMMTSALVAVGTFSFVSSANAVDFFETPTNPVIAVGNGAAAITTSGFFNQNLNVNQSTDRVIIDWNTFNIGTGAKVQFYQPTANSLAVNRVSNDGQFSSINGRLVANGKVMILDPNGVMFGAGSIVDVGAIIASTGDINAARVMAGDLALQLSNFGTGEIVNNGLINAKDSGLVAFVGPTVKNNGIINAKAGRVSLAAGNETATVDLYGDGLVELAYTNKNDKLTAENNGAITAVGGTIQMSAAKAKDIVDSVVNMKGIATVNSVFVKNGKIVLSGKTVNVDKKAVVAGATKINADVANLGTTIIGDVTGSSKVVNVLSNKAKIAQGLGAVAVGGTVNVAAGTYNEHLVVDKKNVTLNGAKAGVSASAGSRGTDETIIIPNSPGVTVTASGVTIDGFTFTGATGADGYGVFVNGGHHATIKNNIIKNVSQYGIYLVNAWDSVVSGNLIQQTGNSGIYALKSDRVQILANQVGIMKGGAHNINGDGILLSGSDDALVYNNRISQTTTTALNIGSGIQIVGSDNVTLRQNTIYNVDWDGIRITKSENTKVFDNDIHHAVRVGVYATLSTNVNIYNNLIDNTTLRGIEIHNMIGNSLVKGNTINASLSDGIWVRNSDDVTIDGNKIGYGLDGLFKTADDSTIAGYGINVTDSDNTVVTGNSIAHTGNSGIYASGVSNLQIGTHTTKNTINFTGSHGVHVVDSAGAKIIANQIGIMKAGSNNINGDGILVENSDGVIVDKNRIAKTTSTATDIGSGIHVKDSDNAYIFNNTAYETAWDGIKVTGGDSVIVSKNDIDHVARAGIFVKKASNLTIKNNDVLDAGIVGLMVQDMLGSSLITKNFVDDIGLDAISVLRSDDVTVSDNVIGYGENGVLGADDTVIGRDGVRIEKSSEVSVTGNKIVNSAENGVHVIDGYGLITISSNQINDSQINGILAEGAAVVQQQPTFARAFFVSPLDLRIVDNTVSNTAPVSGFAAVNLDIGATGAAELSGNTLGNNFTYGLAGYSGTLDLTGATNTIQNTDTGMYFYPTDANALSLVGDTIGTTAFIDQTNLFIDLGPDAFFAPGSPTLLDGNNATYTLAGVTIDPASAGGFVTSDEYDVLEAFINHYVDTQDRGLFFFNLFPVSAASFGIDQKDVIRDIFSVPIPDANGGNLRITGLPSVGGPLGGTPAAPAPGAFDPNAIEPAAGDDSSAPTDDSVANIQPAAGGSDTACWADATAALGQGVPVTFNYGSNEASLLQDAVNCGSGQAQSL